MVLNGVLGGGKQGFSRLCQKRGILTGHSICRDCWYTNNKFTSIGSLTAGGGIGGHMLNKMTELGRIKFEAVA